MSRVSGSEYHYWCRFGAELCIPEECCPGGDSRALQALGRLSTCPYAQGREPHKVRVLSFMFQRLHLMLWYSPSVSEMASSPHLLAFCRTISVWPYFNIAVLERV